MHLVLVLLVALLVVCQAQGNFWENFNKEMEKFNTDMSSFNVQMDQFGKDMEKWSTNLANNLQHVPPGQFANGVNINLHSCREICPEGYTRCRLTKRTNNDIHNSQIITERECFDTVRGTSKLFTNYEPYPFEKGSISMTSFLNT